MIFSSHEEKAADRTTGEDLAFAMILVRLYREGNACDLIRSAIRTRLDDCIASWTDFKLVLDEKVRTERKNKIRNNTSSQLLFLADDVEKFDALIPG